MPREIQKMAFAVLIFIEGFDSDQCLYLLLFESTVATQLEKIQTGVIYAGISRAFFLLQDLLHQVWPIFLALLPFTTFLELFMVSSAHKFDYVFLRKVGVSEFNRF